MQILQLFSIILEAVVAVLAMAAAKQGKPYMYGLAFTFVVYVYYDLAKLYSWQVSESVLPVVFFLATVTALISVWYIFKRK